MPIKVEVNVVNALCSVHDKKGALISSLAKDDFHLFEDGKPQTDQILHARNRLAPHHRSAGGRERQPGKPDRDRAPRGERFLPFGSEEKGRRISDQLRCRFRVAAGYYRFAALVAGRVESSEAERRLLAAWDRDRFPPRVRPKARYFTTRSRSLPPTGWRERSGAR